MDLLDLWRGALSFRALGVLYRGLPPESLTKAAQWDAMTPAERAALPAPKGHGPWSREAMQLARIGDGIDWLIWAKAGGDAKSRPAQYPRPGVEVGKAGNVVQITDAMRAKWQDIADNRGAVSGG